MTTLLFQRERTKVSLDKLLALFRGINFLPLVPRFLFHFSFLPITHTKRLPFKIYFLLSTERYSDIFSFVATLVKNQTRCSRSCFLQSLKFYDPSLVSENTRVLKRDSN